MLLNIKIKNLTVGIQLKKKIYWVFNTP